MTMPVAWSIRNASRIEVRPTPNWTPSSRSAGRRAARGELTGADRLRETLRDFAGKRGAAHRGELTDHRPLDMTARLMTCWSDVSPHHMKEAKGRQEGMDRAQGLMRQWEGVVRGGGIGENSETCPRLTPTGIAIDLPRRSGPVK